jgi:hypothetical protein
MDRKKDRSQSLSMHHKQVLWQIYAPVILGALLLIAGALLITYSGEGRITSWAHVSTVLMALIMTGIGIIVLLVLILLVYLFGKILGILPHYTSLAQAYTDLYAKTVQVALLRLTRPFFAMGGLWEGIQGIIRTVQESQKREQS